MRHLLLNHHLRPDGVHAFATTLVGYMSLPILGVLADLNDEEFEIRQDYLGAVRLVLYLIILVTIHHFTLFVLENEGFRLPGLLFSKIFSSMVFSTTLIYLASIGSAPKKKRR